MNMTPFYNLIEEPWIKVLDDTGRERKFSLSDLFKNCQHIRTLAGETPLQDNAILRTLIALSVTMLYRYSEDGEENLLSDETDVLERFRAVWTSGQYPEAMIDKYFSKWRDRFFLIGGERPFYQVAADKVQTRPVEEKKKKNDDEPSKYPDGVSYWTAPFRGCDEIKWLSAKAFNGEVLESNNSPSPFTCRGPVTKDQMTLDDAARWLIYFMNYADCSGKTGGEGQENGGGWKQTFTSYAANIHPVGKNLFETIMLCSALWNDRDLLYPNVLPAWEDDRYMLVNEAPYGENAPDNLPELYTQQSRKVILHYNGTVVDGMYATGGTAYSAPDAFIDPMLSFPEPKKEKEKKKKDQDDKPAESETKETPAKKSRRIPLKKIEENAGWLNYEGLFQSEKHPARWINILASEDVFDGCEHRFPFVLTGITYGTSNCGVDHTASSRIVLAEKYFTVSTEIRRVKDELKNIRNVNACLIDLGRSIDLVSGMSAHTYGATHNAVTSISTSKLLSESYLMRMGSLMENILNGYADIPEDIHQTEIRSAEQIARDFIDSLGARAFVGHGEKNIGAGWSRFKISLGRISKKMGLAPDTGKEA